MGHKVAVIGAGSWGTAFANLVAAHVDEVSLWARSEEAAQAICAEHRNPRHLSSLVLPENLSATSDISACIEGANELVLVVPSSHLRSACELMAACVPEDMPILVLTKGMEHDSGLLMADVVSDVLGGPERVAVLSGPNHAEEIAEGLVSCSVVAAPAQELAERFRDLCLSHSFRVYLSNDVVGVELCGAVKNVVAIACGAASGCGVGDNGMAALMTRGLAEIGRFVAAYGGDPLTCMGLAGMGDMVATCTSRHSRNRSFGAELVQGTTLEHYEERTNMVVEGARAAKSIRAAAKRLGIEAPTTEAVHAILYEGVDVQEAIDMLLDRRPREEFYGMRETGEER